jgi:hypothetical protein
MPAPPACLRSLQQCSTSGGAWCGMATGVGTAYHPLLPLLPLLLLQPKQPAHALRNHSLTRARTRNGHRAASRARGARVARWATSTQSQAADKGRPHKRARGRAHKHALRQARTRALRQARTRASRRAHKRGGHGTKRTVCTAARKAATAQGPHSRGGTLGRVGYSR